MDQEEASDNPGLSLPFIENRHGGPGRLPFAQRLNDTARNHFVAMCGEFIGTFFFLLLGLSGAQAANTMTAEHETIARFTYISLAFGFSLSVNIWAMYRVSGGQFNPAVTAGLCFVGAVPWARGGLLMVAQLLSAIVSSLVVKAVFPGPLALTKLNAAISITPGQGFLVELFLTFQFVLAIIMMAGEKHAATHIAPVGIGLALFAAELSGAYYTGGSLNPARSFGPAVAEGDFTGSHWIYWLGPFIGSLLAAGTYKFLKVLEFEKANPGQDDRGTKQGQVSI